MLMPSILSLSLIVALCSCSKSDNVAAADAARPLGRAIQPDNDPAQSGTDDTAQMLASGAEQPAAKAATKTGPKAHGKQRPSAAHNKAQATRSRNARRWDEFQAAMGRCVAVTLSAREQCLADARDAYRSAKLDCAALPGRERQECLKYSKLWEDRETDVPTAAATRGQDAATPPRSPSDARPMERNWDSTNTQPDAVGPSPRPAAKE
jgi:hypothetical protein